MNRLLSISLAALLLATGARAAPPSYAAISLVGDKLDIVTYQPQVGSQLDRNTHMALTMSQDELDTAALRAINRSLRAAAPGAQIALLAASTPESFANQSEIFSGSHVRLPAEIDAAVRREGATMLVLVTKHHGDARFKVADGYIGTGKLDGLGFYVDTVLESHDVDTGANSTGYLAPFVYIDVTLIDLATLTVVRRDTIMDAQLIGAAGNAKGVHPWDTLTSAEKVETLKSRLTATLQRVVPSLVTGAALKAE